jgi:hypothetical protein
MAARPTLKSPRFNGHAAPLGGEVRRVGDLRPCEREQMFGLMSRYFNGVTREDFERDLAEKEWAILLREDSEGGARSEAEQSGAIRGFSTLMRLGATVEGVPVVAFFSGDTIIERDFWGQDLLFRLWARLAFGLAQEAREEDPRARVFWFLIASGYKTYRLLPLFFREFWPRFNGSAPPFEARALQVLAAQKFGAQWDSDRGVVRFDSAAPLREDVAPLSGARLADPHVAFFARANPGHARGDELACLCELLPQNLSRAGRRMIKIEREEAVSK